MRGKLSYKLPLSLAAAAVVVGAVLSPVAGASGAPVATWTGAAGDNKFSTAKNWKEGKAPVNGAKLVFNCVQVDKPGDWSPNDTIKLTNDINAKIAIIDTPKIKRVEPCKSYEIAGDTHFQDTVTFSGQSNGIWHQNVASVVIKSAKGIKHLTAGDTGVQFGYPYPSFESYTATGNQMIRAFFKVKRATINSTDKGTIWLGRVSEAITLQQGAALNISDWGGGDREHATNIIFQGDGTIGDAYEKSGAGGTAIPENFTTTLSGNIVVNGTVSVKLPSWQTLKITGNLSGSGKFVVAPDNEGVFINEAKSNTTKTEAGVADSAVEKTITIEGNKKDEHVKVTRKQTAVLSGERQSAAVYEGATLKGDGKVRDLQVAGVVSPSGATKRITVTESFNIEGTGVYRAELLNKKDYSRVAAKSVWLNKGSTLQLTYLPDGKLKKGDVLTIIENTGTDAIQGTFKDMPEGAEVRVGNATFKISYKGGDGNDVTLTAQNDSVAPKAPNTGAASLVANPVAAVAAGAAAVIALFVASKRRVTGKR